MLWIRANAIDALLAAHKLTLITHRADRSSYLHNNRLNIVMINSDTQSGHGNRLEPAPQLRCLPA